jgi:T5SS/PEP-CTERM-associated repeat protein
MLVGYFGTGQVTLSNGLVSGLEIQIGAGAGGNGTLTVTGPNSTNLNTAILVGYRAGSTGTAWITDGAVVTNRFSQVGVGGSGTGTLGATNATLVIGGIGVAGFQSGTATFFGSTVTVNGPALLGGNTNTAFATVSAINSQLLVTNETVLGGSGGGTFVVSNSTWSAFDVVYISAFANGTLTLQDSSAIMTGGAYVGVIGGVTGTVWLAGGTTTASPGVIVGDCVSNAVGQITISNGVFAVTNAAHNAVLDVRDGLVSVVGSGTLLADVIVVTNSCGHIQHVAGGTINGTTLMLDPNLSAAGDGIPNGWKQQYGLDPFDPNLGSQDPDHDGFSNLQEYLAGTNPTDPTSSPFRITGLLAQGNDMFVAWQPGTGVTNALQWTAGAGDGSYQTNNFADLFIVTNTMGSATNYLDVGAATNFPSRYYRVRLVP